MNKGFSLLELSVVIVIIGLLSAGLLSTTDILEKTKIQGTATQFKELHIAYENFKEKFYAPAGDFISAHRYFDDGTNDICGTEQQCNGNGDDLIELGSDRLASESFRAIQHLELANLIKGDFAGIWGTEKSVLKGKLKGNFSFIYAEQYSSNLIKLGAQISEKEPSNRGSFSTEQAERLDLKLDDGNPVKGDLRGQEGLIKSEIGSSTNYEKDCIDEENKVYNIPYKTGSPCILVFVLN